jgi:hypothetical protein
MTFTWVHRHMIINQWVKGQRSKVESRKKIYKQMRNILLILTLLCSLPACSQEVVRFTVTPTEGAGLSPVAIALDGVSFNTDRGRIALFEAEERGSEIPSQLESGVSPRLWFLYDHQGGEKDYVVRQVNDKSEQPAATVVQTDQVTTLHIEGKPVITYHHAEVHPPEGVNPLYRRSAFIHPLHSPGGAVLTRIQPPDHIHHYGIWNPWTSTTINGRDDVDFWNLVKGEGRVQFGGYLGAEQGAVYAALKVRHEHVSYVGLAPGEELLAMNELWDVRVWLTGVDNMYMVDLSTTINTPLKEGVVMNAHRYGGGIGFRATEKWGQDNVKVLTSEGATRNETDGTTARWCLIEGETDVQEGVSGTVFLSHPSNRMHPEPIRMWDDDANSGVGNLFFNFTPIRHQEWRIDPHQNYTLRYRIIVYDGAMTSEEAEKYWKAFSSSPSVRFHDR